MHSFRPINNFRAVVHAIIAANKIINSKFNKDKDALSYSLNIFINYYEQMDSSLNQWVFSCIRMPFLSIINVDNLDLNITNYNVATREGENAYIRLETRLKGFLKNLKDAIQEDRIDTNIIAFLNILITDDSYIPKEFFVLFEYSRIATENNLLKNLDEYQKQMILAVYIFCKVICKNILIEGKFSQELNINARTKNNFKMCASVFYRGVIDYFKEKCKILRNIENIKTYNDNPNKNESTKRKNFYYNFMQRLPSKEIDKSYLNACRKYEGKNKSIGDSLITIKDMVNIKKIVDKMPKFEPDGNVNEIEVIFKNVYSLKELVGYKLMTKKYRFDISSEIFEFILILINYINLKKMKS